MSMWRTLALLALLSDVSASPDDYAQGFELDLVDDAPIYEVTLTRDIYNASVQGDHRDIAVFNARGEQVPHLLRWPDSAQTDVSRRRQQLPVFPVPAGGEATNRNITIKSDGTLIQIGGHSVHPSGKHAYIIDASGVRGRITEMDLTLGQHGDDFMSSISVETSSDLSSWRALVSGYQIAKLAYAGHALSKTSIPISSNGERYYRLRPLAGQSSFSIQSISATVRDEDVKKVAPARFAVTGRHDQQEQSKTTVQFDLQGTLPVYEVAVSLTPNKLLQARLESRAEGSKMWTRRASGVFYALERDGLLLQPNALDVPRITDRYWRLSHIAPNQTDSVAVTLDIGWRPQQLVFLAEGKGPFLVGVGKADATKSNATFVEPLERMARPELTGRALVDERVTLGGAQKSIEQANVPWRQVMLWAVLCFGVLALAAMVLRLVRQMQSTP